MATRLILDELDLNLPALAARLVIIVVVVVGRRARALGAAVGVSIQLAVAIVVQRGRRVLVVFGDFAGHRGGVSRAVVGCGCLAVDVLTALGGCLCGETLAMLGVCLAGSAARTGQSRRVQLSGVGLGPGR